MPSNYDPDAYELVTVAPKSPIEEPPQNWYRCGEWLAGTPHSCEARIEWCTPCKEGNHRKHTDEEFRCTNNNKFNADCKCDAGTGSERII